MFYSGPSRRNVSHQGASGVNSFSMDFDANFGEPPINNPSGWNQQKPANPPMSNFGAPPPPPQNSFNSFYQPNLPIDFGYVPGQQQAPPIMTPSGFSSPQQPQPQAFAAASAMNQQFLMAAGQQILSNDLAAAAVATYSQSIMNKGLGWAEKVLVVLVDEKILIFVFLISLNFILA